MPKIHSNRSLLLILFLNSQIFTSTNIFAQTKKKRIEILTHRLDSLNDELTNLKIKNLQTNSTNTNLLLKVDSLDRLNDSLNLKLESLTEIIANHRSTIDSLVKLNTSLNLKLKDLHEINASNSHTIDSLSSLLVNVDDSYVKQTEIYENCVPKEVYKKDECSILELNYDLVHSAILSEEDEALVNKLIQLMLFNHDFHSQRLDYSKIKIDAIKEFLNNKNDYYEKSHRYVSCSFVNPKLVCLKYSISHFTEGNHIAETASKQMIYGLSSKKVMEFYDIFLPNSENQLMQILVAQIHQLLALDEFEAQHLTSQLAIAANIIRESQNIDDFSFDLDNLFISTQCDKIVSGKLTKVDGFNLPYGLYSCGDMPPPIITLPFSQCAHLLNPKFLALIK